MVEITAAEQNTEKRMENNENNLGNLWDNIKHTNICILSVPEGEEREDSRMYFKRYSWKWWFQHHQTSFTTNAKETSRGRKHKRRKRPAQNKLKTTKKMVIGLYVTIITLNVYGLNAPTTGHRLTGWMKTCTCAHFHLPHHSAQLPKPYVIILHC